MVRIGAHRHGEPPVVSTDLASTSAWRCSQLAPAPSAGSSRTIEASARGPTRCSIAAQSASIPSPVSAETRPAAPRRRRRLVRKRVALLGVEQVDLVPDLDQRASSGIDAELAQHSLDVVRLRLAVFVGDVAHVQDQVGLDHLLERGAEGGDQRGRQVGDEADRVGQDRLGAVRQLDRAQGRIERREQHVGGEHARRGSAG